MKPSERIDLRARPGMHPDVVWIEVEGEIVAVQRKQGTVHLISDTGALLWRFLDGCTPLGDLASDVAAVFGIDPVQAGDDVATFVISAIDDGLLTVEPGASTRS